MTLTSLTARLAETIDAHEARLREAPLSTPVTPAEIRAHLARYDFGRACDADELYEDVTQMLWKWAEHARNPRHFGLFRPNVDPLCVIADALVGLYDPNLATWNFSPAANEIERHVLGAIGTCFGFESDASVAHFTSGGQEANHTSVIAALTHRFPRWGEEGMRALPGQPVMYISQEGHHSFEKIAHACGLGRGALRHVPVGPDLRLDVDALRRMIRADRESGCIPFLLIATAGTTNAGVLDPLPELADFAAENELWLHVDAAWGGAIALSDRMRPLLAGIERADSITCDAHKWLSVTVGAGMFFCRHRAAIEASFGVRAAYVPEQAEDTDVPFITSMQWSRRFIGLKVFMSLAKNGFAGIGERIERQTEVGEYLRSELERAGWRLLNPTPLPVACFTHDAIDRGEAAMSDIVRSIVTSNEAWISKTRLRDEIDALRACVTNFETTEGDIDALIESLGRALSACRR